jgi:transcriptional regulator with XRE-family HTH domain
LARCNASPLGRNLWRLRAGRRWTLVETARRTGLSVGTLSRVENGLLSLTFANLSRLAEGFDVPVGTFFADDTARASSEMTVTRRGEGLRHAEPGFELEYLAPGAADRRLVPMLTRVKARSLAAWGPALRHPGEEFAYVVSGAVDFSIEAQPPVRLEAGDSVIFDSGRAHAAVAVGEADALLVSAILPHDAAGSIVAPAPDGAGRDHRRDVTLERPEGPAGAGTGNRDAGQRRRRRAGGFQDEHR